MANNNLDRDTLLVGQEQNDERRNQNFGRNEDPYNEDPHKHSKDVNTSFSPFNLSGITQEELHQCFFRLL